MQEYKGNPGTRTIVISAADPDNLCTQNMITKSTGVLRAARRKCLHNSLKDVPAFERKVSFTLYSTTHGNCHSSSHINISLERKRDWSPQQCRRAVSLPDDDNCPALQVIKSGAQDGDLTLEPWPKDPEPRIYTSTIQENLKLHRTVKSEDEAEVAENAKQLYMDACRACIACRFCIEHPLRRGEY
jgi:hypothetical protein